MEPWLHMKQMNKWKRSRRLASSIRSDQVGDHWTAAHDSRPYETLIPQGIQRVQIERKTLNYSKLEFSTLGNAITAVRGRVVVKGILPLQDCFVPRLLNATPCAYEVDAFLAQCRFRNGHDLNPVGIECTKSKGETTMKYGKPELSTLANAIAAVQSRVQFKKIETLPDSNQVVFPMPLRWRYKS